MKKKSVFFFKINFLIPLIAVFALFFQRNDLFAVEKNQFDWFWFFYERDNNQYQKSVVYRPFYMKNVYEDGSFEASLMPIIFWRTKTDKRDEWKGLFGLIGSLDYLHDDGVKDYDFGFFPFYYYGKSADEKERYRLIWPIGGTIKGKFAHEEISAWAFPGFLLFVFFPPASLSAVFSFKYALFVILSILPVYASYKDRDYNAWAVMWPLIQRGQSHNRDEFRVLPFYAHNYKKDFYDNYSVLMLFNWRKIMYKDDELNTLLVIPFIGTKWSRSGRISASTLLWPLFSWGYDKKNGDMEINMPWPIIQIMDSENPKITKRIFFPIYGLYQYRNKETFFFTPLYFTLKEKSQNLNSEYYIFSLIVWYFERDYKTRHNYYGNSWYYFKIWPLFQMESNDLGDYSVNLLSLLPLRDPSGYEKLYQPFWSIFEYRRLRTGEKRLGILMRTFYQRWGKDFHTMKVAFIIPLFTYSESGNVVREATFFLSMFGYENMKQGRFVRIFWIPVKIGEGIQGEKSAGGAKEGRELFAEEDNEKERFEPHVSSYMAKNTEGDSVRFTYHLF